HCDVESKKGTISRMKTITRPLKHSMNRLACPLALLLIPLALACAMLSLTAREAHAQCPQICTGFEQSLTAFGTDALRQTTNGERNTAFGDEALASNTNGEGNTAVGDFALSANVVADGNTAVGDGALTSNTGEFNTAIGNGALFDNTGGFGNTTVGF